MLIVVVIAAVLLVTLIKPIVMRASQSASETISGAEAVAKAALFILG
jgi:competence protein ComGC